MLIFCGSSPSVYRYTYSCTDLYKPHTMYRGQLIYMSDVSVNKTPDLYLCNVQLPLSWLSEWMLSVAVIVCVSDCVVDQPLLLLSCLIYLCRVFIYSYLIKFPYQRNIQISKHFRNWYSSCFLVWNRLYSWWFHDDKPTPVCVCECLMSNCCEVCRLRAVICPCSAEIVPTC